MGGTPTSTTLWTVVATPTYPSATGSPSNHSDGDGNGNATSATKAIVIGISTAEYTLGAFLPTIVATLLSFCIKLISINARLMQPFHALATADEAHGAPAASSLLLRFDTWAGMFSLFHAVRRRQPVLALSDLLVLAAGLLAPFAAEAVSVHEYDPDCIAEKVKCYGSLGVSTAPGRVLEGLMSAIVLLLLVLFVLLSVRRWETGVNYNPWSIAGMASLCLDPELRKVLRGIPGRPSRCVEDASILSVLSERKYSLANFQDSGNSGPSIRGYGVVTVSDRESIERNGTARRVQTGEPTPGMFTSTQPFALLTWWGRCIMLFVFSCVLIILVYYENTSADSGFERFMDSESFGVKFFFTALGVLLGYCMETMFRCE